jgi:hypothetical protein
VTDPGREEGDADHDVRHVLKVNAIWEIPYKPSSRALQYLAGGWQLNAITVFQSGGPFSVICGLPYPQCDFNADGQSNERVNVTTTDLGNPSQEEWLAGVLTSADYTLPARGSLATQARNAFRGPSYLNTDLSLFKNLPVPWLNGRSARVQIRIEAFNLFNTAHLGTPQTAINNSLFGRVTGLRTGTQPRVIQLGGKLIF